MGADSKVANELNSSSDCNFRICNGAELTMTLTLAKHLAIRFVYKPLLGVCPSPNPTPALYLRNTLLTA